MKKIIPVLILLFISTSIFAITLDDVIRLSKAKVGDEIILSVIAVSDTKLKLSTDDIIKLKKEGVSDKVISKLILSNKPAKQAEAPSKEQVVTRTKRKELSPFDQFFLSTYYSHTYGHAEKDYDSPRNILEQGLYYGTRPRVYLNPRYVRIYGGGYSSVPGNRFGHTYSPFSILVPRNNYSYYPGINLKFRYHKKK